MKSRLFGSSSLAVIGLLLAPAVAMAEPQIGVVIQEEFTGAAGIRLTGAQEELRFSQPVHAEEKVVTEQEEWTQVQFLDDSTLYVGVNSVVVLDKFVYDPATQLGSAAISLTKGAFRFVSGEMKNEEAIRLQTPKSTLIIRGTTVTAFLFDDGSELIDIDGQVLSIVCPGGGSTAPVGLASGQAVLIDYMCNTTVGHATVSESGPPELYAFNPLGGGSPLGGQENLLRGVDAGDRHADSPVSSTPFYSSPSYSPPSEGDGDTTPGGECGGDGCGGGECGDGI